MGKRVVYRQVFEFTRHHRHRFTRKSHADSRRGVRPANIVAAVSDVDAAGPAWNLEKVGQHSGKIKWMGPSVTSFGESASAARETLRPLGDLIH